MSGTTTSRPTTRPVSGGPSPARSASTSPAGRALRLLAAHDWLDEGGLFAWLIPGEFLDVNYGVGLKEYLTTRVNLLRIHRFFPSDVQFADALVSSAVVVFERAGPSRRAVVFSQGGRPTAPDSAIEVPLLL